MQFQMMIPVPVPVGVLFVKMKADLRYAGLLFF